MNRVNFRLGSVLCLCFGLGLWPGPRVDAEPQVPTGGEAVELRLPAFDASALEPAVGEQLTSLRRYVESVLASDATSAEQAEAIGELGRHYQAYQLTEPAEACFELAARLAPRDFRWRYHLGYLYQTSGRLEEAAAAYERALGIVPEVPPALIRLGQVYKSQGRLDAAVEVLERAFQLDPTASAALAVLGEIDLSEKRYEAAVERLERALELENDANLLYYPLALAYRGLGEEEKARQLLERRGKVGVRPADPLIDGLAALTTGERVHLLRGRTAFGARRFEEAVEEFRLAVAADPESVAAQVNLGTALAAEGKSEEAVAIFRRAIELAPGNATARFNLGMVLAGLGQLEEARDELRGALLYAPADGVAHYELGRVLEGLSRPEEALVHYALAVEHAPPAEGARLAQARVLIELDRWGDALASLEEAHRALPTSSAVTFALARVLAAGPLLELRNGGRAVELAMGLHDSGAGPARAELVASAMAEAGRCEEAADWQRRALVSTPEGGAEENLERMRRRLEHYEAVVPCRPPGQAPPPGQP